jgi:hypothetical protein
MPRTSGSKTSARTKRAAGTALAQSQSPEPPPPPPAVAAAIAEATEASTLDKHDQLAKELKNRGLRERLGQRKVYAFGVIGLTGAQLAFADFVFCKYAIEQHWDLSSQALDVFLGATVVQVIGVVLAIAKGLFDDPD